jgi:hypothetical protein
MKFMSTYKSKWYENVQMDTLSSKGENILKGGEICLQEDNRKD